MIHLWPRTHLVRRVACQAIEGSSILLGVAMIGLAPSVRVGVLIKLWVYARGSTPHSPTSQRMELWQ